MGIRRLDDSCDLPNITLGLVKRGYSVTGKRLVLVGAGHAHLETFRCLHEMVRRGAHPVVINPSPYYSYSGLGPGVLSGRYRPEQGRVDVRRLVELRGARFLTDTVEAVEPGQGRLHLASGTRVDYDVISFNIGSTVPLDGFARLEGQWIAAKPIANFPVARQRLLELLRTNSRPRLLVVGGGPAGVEISGNLIRLLGRAGAAGQVVLAAAGQLLGRFPERARRLAAASLEQRGVRLLQGRRVLAVESACALLEDGQRLDADYTIIASGVQIAPLFRESGLPVGPAGGLLVNQYLQCVGRPEVFGGGDCIDFAPRPLDKIGVIAYHQNTVLRRNLAAALAGGSLHPFTPPSPYTLLFNLGDGTAVYIRGGFCWKGRPAFLLKDSIDQRFMKGLRRPRAGYSGGIGAGRGAVQPQVVRRNGTWVSGDESRGPAWSCPGRPGRRRTVQRSMPSAVVTFHSDHSEASSASAA